MSAFSPEVKFIRARARRVLNTGQYQSFEVQTEIEAVPDPNFKVSENIERLNALAIKKVDEACATVEARLEAAEAKEGSK